MIDEHPQADRILIARLSGISERHAQWRDLTASEEAAAVAELRELAGGRADLLAEVCGIGIGASDGQLNEPIKRQAAELCRKAGADEAAIPRWIEEGRRRTAQAGRPPFSEPRYRRPGGPGPR